MPARMDFTLDLGPSAGRDGRPASAGGPMRLLVLGDFSGRAPAERPPLAERPTHRIDVDRIDTVIERLAPRVALPEGPLPFARLDDWHPDALYARCARFEPLRQARARPPGAGSDLLGALLGRPAVSAPPVATPAPAAQAAGIEGFIRGIVAPHIVADTSAQAQADRGGVDAALAEVMRGLLRDPAFRSLESAWRGVHGLAAGLELDETLELHLFDVTRDELLADVVAAQGRLAQTGLHRALAERWRQAPDGRGWSALVGLYRFGPGDADIGLLAALGLIAARAGGPLLVTADPALSGADSAALAGWHALRRSEAAPWIGLAAPRLLLRQPYGRRSDPIDAFAFEEIAGTPSGEDFLWGHPGLAVALLIGRAFTARGWAFEPGDERELGDLPAYSFVQDGEPVLQPCAEQWLDDEAAQAWLDAGLMPLRSHHHRNAVTLPRLQSVAEPAQRLAGLGRARA